MKLRSQFAVFQFGLILIPILFFGILFLVRYNNLPERILIPGYTEINKLAKSELTPETWEYIKKKLEYNPPEVEVAIISDDDRALYSTIAEIPEGKGLSNTDLYALIRNSSSRYTYQLEIPTKEINTRILVLSRFIRTKKQQPNLFVVLYSGVFYVFLLLIIFSVVMVTVIAHLLIKSVTVLEGATRDLAEGNLSKEVSVDGCDEIKSLSSNLNKMRLSLQEDKLRQSRFIMGVSHDLRTPVALIKGYTEAISDGVVDNPDMKRKSFEIIGQKITQLEEMIDELINFVKLDTGEWRHDLKNQRIAPVLTDFARRLLADGEIMKRKIYTSINIPESLMVSFDEHLLIRALENLSSNAIRYTAEGGNVKFAAYITGQGDRLEITISDNGYGIAEKDIPFIFDPFYRGSNSRRENGTGLGLAVVQSVVESHGWTIDVSQIQTGGTVFNILIPIDPSVIVS